VKGYRLRRKATYKVSSKGRVTGKMKVKWTMTQLQE
jgi:hypothetical protein